MKVDQANLSQFPRPYLTVRPRAVHIGQLYFLSDHKKSRNGFH